MRASDDEQGINKLWPYRMHDVCENQAIKKLHFQFLWYHSYEAMVKVISISGSIFINFLEIMVTVQEFQWSDWSNGVELDCFICY